MRTSTSFFLWSSLFLLCSTLSWSQVSSKVTNDDRYGEYIDSIQEIDYPFILPFLGNKVRDAGYDLPKPAGVMLGYYNQKQDLLIENLSVGFGDMDDLVDISDLVEFSKVYTSNHVLTFRPDVWILPFMNVYAIFNRFEAYTDVVLSEPFELVVPQVTTSGYGGGFGTALAYGWGPMWASGSVNIVWSTTPKLEKPTNSFNTSFRIGSQVWNKKRTQHISIWAGVNYQTYVGSNGGSYDMAQLIPDDAGLAEDLQEEIREIRDGLNEHYEEFCSTPGNAITCAVLDPILEELSNQIDDKIDGLEPPALDINYSFNSSPARKVNMVAGAQYTLNKRFDFRTEFGFIGRRSFMLNVNYRFGFVERKS